MPDLFEGGRIVITVGGIPYRCPPAPLEFTFLLDEWLAKHDLRSKTEIQYLFPLPRVFPIESVAEVVTPLLEDRHIGYTVFFNFPRVGQPHTSRPKSLLHAFWPPFEARS